MVDRLRYRPIERSRRAHQHGAIECDGVLAGLAKYRKQTDAFLAGGEQPAIFDPEHAHRHAAALDELDHLAVAHAGLEAALEVGASKLDRVETCRLGGGATVGKRR